MMALLGRVCRQRNNWVWVARNRYFSNVSTRGDPVFSVEWNNIRYGEGALNEVGDIASDLQLRKVAVFTDKGIRKLDFFQTVISSLKAENIEPIIFDEVSVEPTDDSFKHATKFASQAKVDGFISVGGGSVMDTAKAANLYSTFPTDDFFKYVNAPIGRAELPPGPLKPHIACPTTSGTGSETTGIAICDILSMKAKTGIVNRHIRPTVGVIDPVVTKTLPPLVCAATAFDVLSHAIESLTARPHSRRAPASKPRFRPLSQGANKWADTGCIEALKLVGKYLVRATHNAHDTEARESLLFASTLAGIAFGNVGCHLPHGMSYPVSGLVKNYHPPGYPTSSYPIIPHGVSVILNSPSVFRMTAKIDPQRHLLAAEALGADINDVSPEDAGEVLAHRIIEMMKATNIPNGLKGVGYDETDIPKLVEGSFPQKRLLHNAALDNITPDDLAQLFKGAMSYW